MIQNFFPNYQPRPYAKYSLSANSSVTDKQLALTDKMDAFSINKTEKNPASDSREDYPEIQSSWVTISSLPKQSKILLKNFLQTYDKIEPIGIRNSGTLCHMICIIQMLINLPMLYEILFKYSLNHKLRLKQEETHSSDSESGLSKNNESIQMIIKCQHDNMINKFIALAAKYQEISAQKGQGETNAEYVLKVDDFFHELNEQ